MDNIIYAHLNGKTVCKTAPVYQYNHGMNLELIGANLPDNFRADFSNDEHGTSKAVLGSSASVSVPYEYFVPGRTIHCWIVFSGDNYTVTKLHIMIPVSGRAQPTDEEPDPDEQDIIDQAITALNEAVAATGQDVITTDEAKEAAQTAQAKAEEAQEAAEDAQTAAETAQRNAQGYAANAAGSAQSAEQSKTAAQTAAESVAGAMDTLEATIQADLQAAKESGMFDGKDGKDGTQGPKGDKGDTGAQGPKGDTGETGPQGAKGDKGDKGDTGATGPQGAKGDKGDKGEQGEPGTGISVHICSSAEYDATTRVPTVQNPETNTFYLVPAENAASPDMFVEWIYANNAWEMFGSATVEVPVQDVQVNGVSVLSDGVANVPIANGANLGAVKIDSAYGLSIDNGGIAKIKCAGLARTKAGTNAYEPIVPSHQHESAFYGLAKAAGDATQSASSNPVGTYTDEAKTAIQTMLDVPAKDDIPSVPVQDVQVAGVSVLDAQGVANVPPGAKDIYGVVKLGYGSSTQWYGLDIAANGSLMVAKANNSDIKGNWGSYKPIVPDMQHQSTFYGLAKAAGDTTQSASSNAVGNYTDSAKSAIHEMLNGAVSVSGTTPVINALPGVRYVCGEVATLEIIVPASGCIDVTFESGTTATVLTVTPPTGVTLKWANGFDPTSLDTNTTYEINICDGLGVAGTWT